MSRVILLLVLTLLAGCTVLDGGGEELNLDPKWRPLKSIKERGDALDLIIKSDTAITTIGKHCYVKDLNEWLGRNPVNSRFFDAIMRHEQEHSIRQLDYGLNTWLTRYSYDKEFALIEEQIGWYYQIKHLQRTGGAPPPTAIAATLSSYKNLSGRLISFEDALQWARDVISGRWAPPE